MQYLDTGWSSQHLCYQASHSLWQYIISQDRSAITHHPVSANRKIYQHINKCLYEEQVNISLSEIKYQCCGYQMFICTQKVSVLRARIRDFFNSRKAPEGQTERGPKDGLQSKQRREEQKKKNIHGISTNLFVLQKILRYQHHLSDYHWQISDKEIQHCHCCE